MKKPTEAQIQAACLDWLRLWGAFTVRVNSGAMRVGKRYVRFNDEPGCSDTVVCLPGGRFAAIEFKREAQKPTREQESFLTTVRARGGLGLVVTSLDDLRQQLAEHHYHTDAIQIDPMKSG